MKLLKLVIVDDEPILLSGLLNTYDWAGMGFKVVGSAQNGEQAIQVIKAVRPHVVLTDIRMKQITGLMVMEEIQKRWLSMVGTGVFTILGLIYIALILIVLMNSFKKKVYINKEPFTLPTEKTWNGLENYITAIEKYDLLSSVGWTIFITVGSVLVILICTSMCAWYITRVKTRFTKALYLLCVFSMVVPFQMVMFTLSLVADRTRLNTPWGIIIIYLGFGAGLAVFMFCGFVKSIPLEIEEAALIDGCNPLRTFFSVVLPIMKPTYISVGILETMWIWNDFLLPYLVLNLNKFKTLSIAIQYMKGSYGRVDMGAIMAALILAVIPVIIFYLACQKHIIKGVAAGAVKG